MRRLGKEDREKARASVHTTHQEAKDFIELKEFVVTPLALHIQLIGMLIVMLRSKGKTEAPDCKTQQYLELRLA